MAINLQQIQDNKREQSIPEDTSVPTKKTLRPWESISTEGLLDHLINRPSLKSNRKYDPTKKRDSSENDPLTGEALQSKIKEMAEKYFGDI